MPLKSKAQERYLWAKHPKVAQEFEDATPSGTKLPEHVKMAGGGVVGDDWMQGVDDFLGKLYGVKKDDVPRGTSQTPPTPQSPQSPTPATPLAPVSTNTGSAEDLPSQTEKETRIQDSNPGHTQEELDKYLKGQEGQVDKYGPEEEKAVIENILKSRNSVGNRFGQAISGAGDAAMMAFTGQNPGFEKNFNENRNRTEDLAAKAIPDIQNLNLENIGQKQKLEGMTSSSPLGGSQAQAVGGLLSSMGVPKSVISQVTQNPAAARSLMEPWTTMMGAKEKAQMEMLIHELEIAQQGRQLGQTTANQQEQRALDLKKMKLEHPILNAFGQFDELDQGKGFDHASIPSGGTYRAPDGTLRRKK